VLTHTAIMKLIRQAKSFWLAITSAYLNVNMCFVAPRTIVIIRNMSAIVDIMLPDFDYLPIIMMSIYMTTIIFDDHLILKCSGVSFWACCLTSVIIHCKALSIWISMTTWTLHHDFGNNFCLLSYWIYFCCVYLCWYNVIA
jgi:hypothetical protein